MKRINDETKQNHPDIAAILERDELDPVKSELRRVLSDILASEAGLSGDLRQRGLTAIGAALFEELLYNTSANSAEGNSAMITLGTYSDRNTPARVVTVEGKFSLYFSYNTIIAFSTPKVGIVVSQNSWSNTTGRHLNEIDGGTKEAKAERLPRAEFEARLTDLFVSF